MSGVYFQTFTCTKCGRRFIKRMGGFVIRPEEANLKVMPLCNSCKREQTINAWVKAINVLKKIMQRK